jgi:hypothetical protein
MTQSKEYGLMSRPRLVKAGSLALAVSVGLVATLGGCGSDNDTGTQVQQTAEQKAQQADMESKIKDAYGKKGPQATQTKK